MSIFQKSVVNKYLENLDKQIVLEKWNAYKNHFLNPSVQEEIRGLNEERYKEELFVRFIPYKFLGKWNGKNIERFLEV